VTVKIFESTAQSQHKTESIFLSSAFTQTAATARQPNDSVADKSFTAESVVIAFFLKAEF